jgi:hypothetical protein
VLWGVLKASGYVALNSGSRRMVRGSTQEKMRGNLNTGRETIKTLGRTTPATVTVKLNNSRYRDGRATVVTPKTLATEILEPFAEGPCLTRDRFQYVDSLI